MNRPVEFYMLSIEQRARASVVLLMLAMLCAWGVSLILAVKHIFIDRPAIQRILDDPLAIDAELLGCYWQSGHRPNDQNRRTIDFRWIGSDGKLREARSVRIPGLDVSTAICTGGPKTVRILTSNAAPWLPPILEADKGNLTREQPFALAVFCVSVMAAVVMLDVIIGRRAKG